MVVGEIARQSDADAALSAAFPTAQFIVILRHPQVMAALGKWVDDDPQALLRYGLDACDRMARILPTAFVLRYEDLVARGDAPGGFRFLDLEDETRDRAARRQFGL